MTHDYQAREAIRILTQDVQHRNGWLSNEERARIEKILGPIAAGSDEAREAVVEGAVRECVRLLRHFYKPEASDVNRGIEFACERVLAHLDAVVRRPVTTAVPVSDNMGPLQAGIAEGEPPGQPSRLDDLEAKVAMLMEDVARLYKPRYPEAWADSTQHVPASSEPALVTEPPLAWGPPRDPARIEPTLALLRSIWEANPDLRLGQIIDGAATYSSVSPLFHVEDDKMVAALRAFRDAGAKPTDTDWTPPAFMRSTPPTEDVRPSPKQAAVSPRLHQNTEGQSK